MRLFDTCAHDPRNASSDLYFCPISTDERHRPAGRSGQCSDNCEQIDYVGSALPVCESSCPASDATATDLGVSIDRMGWGGDAGFRLGARYHLVLFASGQDLSLRMTLRAASGRVLYDGGYSHYACQSAMHGWEHASRHRRLDGEISAGEIGWGRGASADGGRQRHAGSHVQSRGQSRGESRGVGSPEAAHAVAWHPLRGLLRRRESWLEGLQGADRVRWRLKEGEGARWAGRTPTPFTSHVGSNASVDGAPSAGRCAEGTAPRGSRVHLEGGCEVATGTVSLPNEMTRIELGDAFVLHEPDFPLHLAVEGLRASLRGAEARSAADEPHTAAPSLFVSFYTDEIDWASRYWLWVGVPVGWVLLSCCVCCGLCCCCSESPEKKLDFDAAGMQLSADELEQDEATPWRRGRMPQPSSHRRPPLDDDDDSDH